MSLAECWSKRVSHARYFYIGAKIDNKMTVRTSLTPRCMAVTRVALMLEGITGKSLILFFFALEIWHIAKS